MAVRIVTDSSSDLPFSLQEEWGITILPLRVLFGEEEFVDGELTAGQFYERLAQAKELPQNPHRLHRRSLRMCCVPALRRGTRCCCFPCHGN